MVTDIVCESVTLFNIIHYVIKTKKKQPLATTGLFRRVFKSYFGLTSHKCVASLLTPWLLSNISRLVGGNTSAVVVSPKLKSVDKVIQGVSKKV